MKFLIWFICIFIFELIKEIIVAKLEMNFGVRIHLGGIWVFILSLAELKISFAISSAAYDEWQRHKDRKDAEKNIYNVMICDVVKKTVYKKKMFVDTEKISMPKFYKDKMFYAVDLAKDGKKIRTYYPKEIFDKKVDEFGIIRKLEEFKIKEK